ncbi:3-hydroxyacyl-CoA dehydrogenase NAD-binding domain-containing protein [Aquabacter sp. L1I39]|uniref:3-hydroxyacyl-CoA dehydrogenase NAD-binding domain-containing protein n=1 Tax=Aquabacter sp. L1I39 TaxID=2820278 RepID=UPI001FFD9679|nr:3-hydroxyacyl-CoA dehydrogenase NAD-binding domain-containing protein [Aquabacter sp. L1I39]
MTLDLATVALSDTVTWALANRVALLTIDNPPVNSLGHSVRQGLAAGIAKALGDAAVDAVVIRGAGRMFCGGADIRQFNTPAATAEPLTRDILSAVENGRKPVIAAIHGVALGGGLELALGCHYRIIAPDAKVGLPEIKLGIIPGGGGTQRLPRLAGIAAAVEMILGGAAVSAGRALELGIVDRIAEGDLTGEALAFAAEVAELGDLPLAALRPAPADDDGIIAREEARMSGARRTGAAERAAVAAIAAAATQPFEAGLAFERAQFLTLLEGTESKAIRHLFLAERAAVKVPGITGVAAPHEVKSVGIIGAGTMGGAIAMAFANAGIPVTLVEREDTALERGLSAIRKNYGITVAKGRLAAEDMEARIARISPTTDLAALADADLIIEAVFEDMAVKQTLFRQLDGICKPGAVLATNTSRLNVNEVAAATARPEAVIGLHFFSPANVMRLLEIVRADKTAPEVIATSMAVAQHIGKTPVLVGVCEGFVGNRMLTAYWREAGFLLEEGASPRQIDKALEDFGMAMGPLAMADLAGLDINWATRKRLAPTRPKHLRYSQVADRICELGRFGQKTGAGYYRYENGSRAPIPDPVVDALIEDCAREAGITRRAVSDEEIVERAIYALVNEAAYILEDGIAQRASDIDVVYVNGYGFPPARGGPMFYADTVGPARVLERIDAWEKTQGAHWRPSPLFRRVAEGGGRFNG